MYCGSGGVELLRHVKSRGKLGFKSWHCDLHVNLGNKLTSLLPYHKTKTMVPEHQVFMRMK